MGSLFDEKLKVRRCVVLKRQADNIILLTGIAEDECSVRQCRIRGITAEGAALSAEPVCCSRPKDVAC